MKGINLIFRPQSISISKLYKTKPSLKLHSSSFLDISNIIKKQKGTTANTAIFSKSSNSFEITPILDQSPLYLYFETLIKLLIANKRHQNNLKWVQEKLTLHQWNLNQTEQWKIEQQVSLKILVGNWVFADYFLKSQADLSFWPTCCHISSQLDKSSWFKIKLFSRTNIFPSIFSLSPPHMSLWSYMLCVNYFINFLLGIFTKITIFI